MIRQIEVSPEITLVESSGKDGVLVVEGYTEILDVFRTFLKKHPPKEKVARFELQFDPAPWNTLHARPFIHVKNEEIPALLERWESQLQFLIVMEKQNIITA